VKTTVVIPTLNRPIDLERTIRTISKQTCLPNEVIIIDQSDDNRTKDLIENMKSDSDTKVSFRYVHSSVKSLSKARNLGLEEVKEADIVTFFDDDVVLEEDYFEEIIKVFEQKDAVVVGGQITNWGMKTDNKIINFINRIFFLPHYKKGKFEVQPSINPTEDYIYDNLIPSEWASGCNFSVRTEVARTQRFDENLIKYALAEDVDYTYSLFKKNNGGIFISPSARLEHLESQASRIPNQAKLYMDAVHKRYLFHKHFEKNLMNYTKFYWSRIGHILKLTYQNFVSKEQSTVTLLKSLLSADLYAEKHKKEIKNFDLRFFHNWMNR
jgi:GT2 family glycosyltransferase